MELLEEKPSLQDGKNAVLKAIEGQLVGSKAKDAYRRTAHQAIVSGLRNISRSRGKLPATLSLICFE